MSSNQDQDTVDQRHVYSVYGTRPGGDNIGCRPIFLVYGLPLALGFIGVLIEMASRPYTWLWTVGELLPLLSMSAILGIPGLLVATRHRWASLGQALPLRHPRLGGLVQAWIGLIVFVGTLVTGASSFITLPFLETQNGVLLIYLGVVLGGIVPMLAVFLFDRRR